MDRLEAHPRRHVPRASPCLPSWWYSICNGIRAVQCVPFLKGFEANVRAVRSSRRGVLLLSYNRCYNSFQLHNPCSSLAGHRAERRSVRKTELGLSLPANPALIYADLGRVLYQSFETTVFTRKRYPLSITMAGARVIWFCQCWRESLNKEAYLYRRLPLLWFDYIPNQESKLHGRRWTKLLASIGELRTRSIAEPVRW